MKQIYTGYKWRQMMTDEIEINWQDDLFNFDYCPKCGWKLEVAE